MPLLVMQGRGCDLDALLKACELSGVVYGSRRKSEFVSRANDLGTSVFSTSLKHMENLTGLLTSKITSRRGLVEADGH